MDNSIATSEQENCKVKIHNNKLPLKTVKNPETDIKKEARQKSFWRNFKIFSKIKKSNKAKIKETDSVLGEANTQTVNTSFNNEDYKKCKSTEMENKLNSKYNNIEENEENLVTISRSGFFGKINFENILKLFVDVHKKKQLVKEQPKEPDTEKIEAMSSSSKTTINALQRYDSSSNIAAYNTNNNEFFSLHQSDSLQNPFNSPKLECNFNLNSLNTSANLSNELKTDSTLNLLENVRTKLKDFLVNEANNDEKPKHSDDTAEIINCNKDNDNNVESSELGRDSESLFLDKNIEEAAVHQCQAKLKPFISEGCDDKKSAYAIMEGDIKSMIKELLKESKDLKESIVATGIQEDPVPPFSPVKIDPRALEICNGICDELMNLVYQKNRFILNSKKHLNVTFKQDVEEEVESLLSGLLDEVVEKQLSVNVKPICVNYCFVENLTKAKEVKCFEDKNRVKFRESAVYCLTKNLRHMKICTKTGSAKPRVTVHNLSSPTNKIKFVLSENSLTSRIRRSAALLMALYDEMRDYSYYSCTTNILCDLYDSMVKQGLITITNGRPRQSIGNLSPITTSVVTLVNNRIDNGSQQEIVENPPEQSSSVVENQELSAENSAIGNSSAPSSSSNDNPSNSFRFKISVSNESFSSESDNEETETKCILSNLTYTYQSDEEINSPEEVKKIDDNLNKNRSMCNSIDINESRTISDESLGREDITLNESEVFLKK